MSDARMERAVAQIALLLAPDDQATVRVNFDALPEQVRGLRGERDRLQAIVEHLRESAERAIGQDRDDEYDEGNRDAWVYVRNVLDGKAGT